MERQHELVWQVRSRLAPASEGILGACHEPRSGATICTATGRAEGRQEARTWSSRASGVLCVAMIAVRVKLAPQEGSERTNGYR